MTPQAQLAMVAWLPIIFYLFNRYPPRTAVMMSFLGGLMFLPERGAGFALPLIPDYTGMVATCYGIVLALAVYDSDRLSSLKLGWTDIPMLIWCICPFFSSMSNGLGAYDGFNATLTQLAKWGLPYFLGRLYFTNLDNLKELAIGIVKGTLMYVPLCIWEGRMSPNLHLMLYGYWAHPSGLTQARRYGGFRPNVFMQHGLMVGAWVMSGTLIGIWLWQAGVLQKVWGQSMKILVWVMLFTVVWNRSTGAYALMLLGVVILFTAKYLRTSLPLLLVICGISYYLYAGVTGTFAGDEIVHWISDNINPDRAESLGFRFDNEEILAEHARDRMIFGWGGWGRNRVYDYNWAGELVDISVTDSLWIIAFGFRGVVGLASLTASLLLPVTVLCFRYPANLWFNPKVAPAVSMAVTVVLFMFDSVLNSMFNPIFPLISGGISGLVLSPRESLTARKKRKKRSSSAVNSKVQRRSKQQKRLSRNRYANHRIDISK